MADRPGTACPVCRGPMPRRARTGRPAVYCSRACQAKAYRARVAARRADSRPRATTAVPVSAAPLPAAAGDGSAADRIYRLTVALVRRAEVAAGAVRAGRLLPDGSGGIDGRPDAIERIARELVATIRGAAATPVTSPCDVTPAPPSSAGEVHGVAAARQIRRPVPTAAAVSAPGRTAVVSAAAGPEEPAAQLGDAPAVAPLKPVDCAATSTTCVVRTVDMSHEFGDGYALVQLESSFPGEWLVRLHGDTIGSVTRVTSLSGDSVRGWEARHHGLKIPRMVRGNLTSRGLAMAAVVYAHGQHCLKAPRRPCRPLAMRA